MCCGHSNNHFDSRQRIPQPQLSKSIYFSCPRNGHNCTVFGALHNNEELYI